MMEYICHKHVQAARIKLIEFVPTFDAAMLRFEDGTHAGVSGEWCRKHSPQPGGYFVQYEDGYQSYSPAKAFEQGYTPAYGGRDSPKPVLDSEIPNRAPRVKPTDLEAEIDVETYFVAGDGVYGAAYRHGDHEAQSFPAALDLLTFCVLVLKNGYTIVGQSACASPENFNAEIGQRLAREDAVRKLEPLLGFRLRDKLAAQS